MRYAFSVFPASQSTNVYDVLLVWQRESFFVDVGSLEPSSMGVITARPPSLKKEPRSVVLAVPGAAPCWMSLRPGPFWR
jgi:hypothetical protein